MRNARTSGFPGRWGLVRPPQGLGPRGRALWNRVQRELREAPPADPENPERWELDQREIAHLTLACRQADDVARLEAVVKKDGTMVASSAGQRVLHPAIAEARQGRLAISRLLGLLELPDAAQGPARSASTRRAQKAAGARWGRLAALDERRGDVG
jgi:phage terminase small subunit